MDGRAFTVVVAVALLAGIVGGVLGTTLTQSSMRMMMGGTAGPMMIPHSMLETMRLMMLDPALRRAMVEMHQQVHDTMERR